MKEFIRVFEPFILLTAARKRRILHRNFDISALTCFKPSLCLVAWFFISDILYLSFGTAFLNLFSLIIRTLLVYFQGYILRFGTPVSLRVDYLLSQFGRIGVDIPVMLLCFQILLISFEIFIYSRRILAIPGFLFQSYIFVLCGEKILSTNAGRSIVTFVSQNEKLRQLKKDMLFECLHPDGAISKFVFQVFANKKRWQECGACLEEFPRNRLITLSNCGNKMCTMCLYHYIEASVNDATGTNLECAYNPEECPPISQAAIAKVFNPVENRFDVRGMRFKLEKAYIRKALAAFPNVIHCPSPDCTNAVFADHPLKDEEFRLDIPQPVPIKVSRATGVGKYSRFGKQSQGRRDFSSSKVSNSNGLRQHCYKKAANGKDLRKFDCAQCKYSYCVVCKAPWTYGIVDHNQLSCELYADRSKYGEHNAYEQLTQKEIREKIRLGIVQKCPGCDILIEKNQGCRHMTCRHCNYQFCWTCGSKWMTCQPNCS